MLTTRDTEENTAFHEVILSGNVDVVRLLVEELDPDLSFSANRSCETPLYTAAKRSGNHLLVAEIMDISSRWIMAALMVQQLGMQQSWTPEMKVNVLNVSDLVATSSVYLSNRYHII